MIPEGIQTLGILCPPAPNPPPAPSRPNWGLLYTQHPPGGSVGAAGFKAESLPCLLQACPWNVCVKALSSCLTPSKDPFDSLLCVLEQAPLSSSGPRVFWSDGSGDAGSLEKLGSWRECAVCCFVIYNPNRWGR